MHTQKLSFELPNQLPKPALMDPAERLFRHVKKPEWGVGLWVHEQRKRRRFRFEDGEIRSFRRGFYHMLLPVDGTRIDVDSVFERIAADHEILAAESLDAKPRQPPVMSFEQQVQVFAELYPGGFQDPDFLNAYRSPIEGRSCSKRHVDPVVERAQAIIGKSALRAAIDDGQASRVHASVVALLQATSLVKPHHLRPLAELTVDKHADFVAAMFHLLHDEARYHERFETWLGSQAKLQGVGMTWSLATVLPAMLRPQRHAVIKPRVQSLQARSLAPRKLVKKTPTRSGYRNGRRVVLATKRELVESGLEPKDLFDVSAFIWETLRPKGRSLLETLSAG